MTRAVIIAVLLALAPLRVPAQAPDSARAPVLLKPADSFFGVDKPKHFLLSFFVQSLTFSALEASGTPRRTAGIGATATAAAVAVGREIHDRRTKGLFSVGDLIWDTLGATAALIVLHHTYR